MHRVNRLEIELHGGEPALARALSERVRRMHRERIAPVVDRVCSELSGGEAVDRIDRLELDLGTVAADDLEDAFVARLEPALRAALAKALRRPAGDQRARASLELLETFALTGSLPWWAPHDREIVAQHFARAAAEAGADLQALLRRIAHDPGALDRIARMCDRDALAALVARAPAGQPLPRSVDREVIGHPSAAGASPPAGRGGERDARRRPDPGDGARPTRQSAGDEAMAQRPSAASRLTDDAPRGWPLVERKPPVPPVVAPQLATSPRMIAGTPRLSPVPGAPAAIRAARRGALARLDELYVADAGLVILWPLLERFFRRTGVLGDDRRFFDEAAQLQAVALVECLATADPAPLEFHLPLAKLLCGRPFESDFVLARPLAPEQLAEGDRLLAAVIDRAPVPADLSIASFRAGFLVRPGALSTRDGAWLLQVERRPHDAVLDRFPWSWGWIKLPWMPEPLRVEW